MIIDFHAHVGLSKVFPPMLTSEMVIGLMDECGIDMAVLLPTASAPKQNPFEDVVEAHEKFPGRFIPFMLINPKWENKLEIMEEGVNRYGLRGVKIHPTFMAVAADDEELIYPVLQKASNLGIPVMIHSGQYPWATAWQVGLAAMDNPNTTIIMAHMGLDEVVQCEAAIKMAKRSDNLILETTGVTAEYMIAKAANEIGYERVVFGSDQPGHHPKVDMEKIMRAKISEEAKRAILGGNAARLFRVAGK